ncbi:MAG TPA: allantoicase [Trebonia sp.]|nr:allantoicase [Trebonia sp.]
MSLPLGDDDPLALPDLASRALRGCVLAASDEFFAEKENLISPAAPTHRPATYGHKGQVYDGWETRRRRGPGGAQPAEGEHDWVIVRLGAPCVVRAVVVDTAFFTGNYPQACAVEACFADGYPASLDAAKWEEIVPRAHLTGDSRHVFHVSPVRRFSHVRLRIYPDGGVARLRVHGTVVPSPELLDGLTVDLAALENGGEVVACSDLFYSEPRNVIAPGLSRVTGEGWETRRRRDPGNEWLIVRLAGQALVSLAEIDTSGYIGNAPGAASLAGRDEADGAESRWNVLLNPLPLLPDTPHRLRLADPRPVTHVRLNVFPDGGIARLRLHGSLTGAGLAAIRRRWDETALHHGGIGGVEHVVIAPDKFKGSLTAAEVAAHVAAGLRRAGMTAPLVELPVADGGDGTVDAAVAAGYKRIPAEVTGPTGSPVLASFALHDGTAVVEAAQACGLALLSSLSGGKLAPLTATSRGVGELILAALAAGAARIVLAIGGVATNDGGAGLAQALGARLLDASGRELPPGGAALAALHTLELPARLPEAEFLVASDVDNPLLGPNGAAAVYGPQKGASGSDVELLDAALGRWADVAERAAGVRLRDAPGAGAAGGLGFGALLLLAARLRPGIELLLDMLSFRSHLDGARLVITGEGSLDTQTLRGKAPAGVARAAASHVPPVPVVAVAGVSSLTGSELSSAGIAAAYTLTGIEPDVTRCMTGAGELTESLAVQIAADWLR